MKKITVAIIGAGIGQKHYNAYASMPDHFHVKTICDTNPDRIRGFLPTNSPTAIETDYQRVLDDAAIDLIDICLPPFLHFEFTKRALEAGKDVVCEKPLSNCVAEVDELIAISKRTGRTVFPVFQYRFGTGIAQLRGLMDAGLTGKAFVGSVETHWNRDTEYYAVDWRGTWAGEQGGAILGHAIHIHDLISFILGPVQSVYAVLDTRVNDIEVEDCAALSITMASGAVVTSSVTLGAATDTTRLRFCFAGLTAESGTTPYTPAEDTWKFWARAPYNQSAIDAVTSRIDTEYQGQRGLSLEIYNAMTGAETRFVNIDEARWSIEFVTAVYHSARTGQPVEFPIKPDHPLYHGWVPNQNRIYP